LTPLAATHPSVPTTTAITAPNLTVVFTSAPLRPHYIVKENTAMEEVYRRRQCCLIEGS
jgi:hypothetical protein